MDPVALLAELEPTASALLERHLARTEDWYPHELVPYSRGRDFEPGELWGPEQAELGTGDREAVTDAVRSALYLNLLTEDNLPYYFRDVDRMFGKLDAWGTWTCRWTAEEGRHAIVIRDYLTVTRLLDPWELERGRMAQVSGGEAPAPAGPTDGLAYLTLQELATRIAHRGTGKLIPDQAGYDIMARVAADENLHYLFYRDMASAALELDPSGMLLAIEAAVRDFAMPGVGIPDFERHAAAVARAGIYDLAVHHDQILVPVVLRHWKVTDLVGLTDEAERARDALLARIERTGRIGHRLAERRQELSAV